MDIHNYRVNALLTFHGKRINLAQRTVYSLWASINPVILDIHNSIMDIHNSIMDIHISIMDIHISIMDIHN